MEELVLILRHWMTMEIGNRARLLRLLRLAHALFSCLFDCFTGRHWAFLCSCIHAVFSCHFTAVPSSLWITLRPQLICSLCTFPSMIFVNSLMKSSSPTTFFVSLFPSTSSNMLQFILYWFHWFFPQQIFSPSYCLSNSRATIPSQQFDRMTVLTTL